MIERMCENRNLISMFWEYNVILVNLSNTHIILSSKHIFYLEIESEKIL